jgi:hypothetical protein
MFFLQMPSGDPSLNADQQQPPAVLSTTDARSRSSSVTSGAGSSSTDALRHRMDRPEVEEQGGCDHQKMGEGRRKKLFYKIIMIMIITIISHPEY